MRIPFWNILKNRLLPTGESNPSLKNNTCDRVNLDLWGLNLSVNRDTTLDIPSELSVIIPHVEFRHKYTASPSPTYETEIIMNSITVVLAPRHPQESPSSSDMQSPSSGQRLPVIDVHYGVRGSESGN